MKKFPSLPFSRGVRGMILALLAAFTMANTEAQCVCDDTCELIALTLCDPRNEYCASYHEPPSCYVPPGVFFLTASTDLAQPGQAVSLAWAATGADECTLYGAQGGGLPASWEVDEEAGTKSFILAENAAFLLVCENDCGPAVSELAEVGVR